MLIRTKQARCVLLAACVLLCRVYGAQTQPAAKPPENPPDALGRNTPRGTVLGFLSAAHKGDDDTAALYLNTRAKGKSAANLAHQLFVVLDRRLPARLNQLSDRPEGSLAFPANPDQDLVGKVAGSKGEADILLDRVDRGKAGAVWLFSRKTLDSVPDLYNEITEWEPESSLPSFLVDTRIAGISLFQWLAILVGLPLAYLATGLLNRVLGMLAGSVRRRWRHEPDLPNPEYLSRAVRLLVLAASITWLIREVSLPLLVRQFWRIITTFLTITGGVWLIIRLNGRLEQYIRRRLEKRKITGALPAVRFLRRTGDVLALFVGLLIALSLLGVNIGAAVAGLGVGGIAVALAAQKTLENVIGGLSLVLDQTVRIGDFVKIGDTAGTVEQIGLRSIRIRTADRTMVSLPNGQVATACLENLSARDKFWFHHVVSVASDSTVEQLSSVLTGIEALLAEHAAVERETIRVSFLRFGPSSFDIELFAYVPAGDALQFFAIQQELLLQIRRTVQETGARIALPSQALYLAGESSRRPSDGNGISPARVRPRRPRRVRRT